MTYLPTDSEVVAALMREQAVLDELHAYQHFFNTAMAFIACLETEDKRTAIALHRSIREQAASIRTGEAWEASA